MVKQCHLASLKDGFFCVSALGNPCDSDTVLFLQSLEDLVISAGFGLSSCFLIYVFCGVIIAPVVFLVEVILVILLDYYFNILDFVRSLEL